MAQGRVIVYGGKGALGSSIVSFLKSKNFWVGSIDLNVNEQADANVIVKPDSSMPDQESDINVKVGELLGEEKLDAIFCVAGGWAGGNAKRDGAGLPLSRRSSTGLEIKSINSADIVNAADSMWKQSVWPSVITASLSTKYMKEGGVVTLPGAQPALKGTPGMMGYGMAKAAVHQLVQSLSGEKSGLPANTTVVGTLPITLDTPMNRKFMASADFSTWTTLEFVSELFLKWVNGEDRPASGSLVQFVTKDNKTELVIA